MKAFLDTSALIDMLDGSQPAIAVIDKLAGECELCTSSINICELLRGVVGKEGERRGLRAICEIEANLAVMPFDAAAAQEAAKLYAALCAKGKPVSEADYLIAGVCAANGIRQIVTQNKKHFCDMPCFEKIITY